MQHQSERAPSTPSQKVIPAPNSWLTLLRMDWNLAIEKNTTALTQIVAGLFVLVGGCSASDVASLRRSYSSSASLSGSRPLTDCAALTRKACLATEGGQTIQSSIYQTKLGSITRRHLISVLRTAEAALRRLIVLFVKVHGMKAPVPSKRTRPMPDFSTFNRNTEGQTPVFNLFDPRKRICLISDDTSVPSSAHAQASRLVASSAPLDGASLVCRSAAATEGGQTDPSYETIPNSTLLLHRLISLDHALKTLPQQAKRLVRIMAQRQKAPAGKRRIPPIRPGIPPGFRDRGKHEVDDVLRECHGLMRDIQMSPP